MHILSSFTVTYYKAYFSHRVLSLGVRTCLSCFLRSNAWEKNRHLPSVNMEAEDMTSFALNRSTSLEWSAPMVRHGICAKHWGKTYIVILLPIFVDLNCRFTWFSAKCYFAGNFHLPAGQAAILFDLCHGGELCFSQRLWSQEDSQRWIYYSYGSKTKCQVCILTCDWFELFSIS